MAKIVMNHVNIMVDKLETNIPFYRDVLGVAMIATPDIGFPAQFFQFDNGAQIHMNELKDLKPHRAHLAITVDDFSDQFRKLKAVDAIDVEAWGKVRRLPSGTMQMFARDPSGNLIEICGRLEDDIDQSVFDDDLVDLTHANLKFVPNQF